MDLQITGFCARALESLTPSQIIFLQNLPKAELHAHLNGSIPVRVLQEMAREYSEGATSDASKSDILQRGIEQLSTGVELKEIDDFFGLFPAIYALTSNPIALAQATRAVLESFLEGSNPQCAYLELRSTPRATENMTRLEYVETVLNEIDNINSKSEGNLAALIVCLDRRMDSNVARECLDIAINMKRVGRNVVGVDLCGDPTAGNMDEFAAYFREAKEAGLGVTLHIAETPKNTPEETLRLLSFGPDRLGHATFLNEEAKAIVSKNKICVEICLSSNLLCKTVKSLDDHHILYHLADEHPIAICTDDILPFRNSLLGEYALLLAPKPLGLGLSEEEVRRVAEGSLAACFRN